ncbi:hypothetical protein EBI_27662 [Enterocytozoon bieneusi H348]|nr:hypothetical protein EBI_27662 [Enterocytozoon bieneusi H348]|eukprot:XP_002651270.1 hypothetical protein EBI_27662 [Enterocytozoon bieneusi H348]
MGSFKNSPPPPFHFFHSKPIPEKKKMKKIFQNFLHFFPFTNIC